MVHCPRCGIANQPAAKFCASCGAPLQAQAPAAPPGWGPAPQHGAPPAAPYPQPGPTPGAPAAPYPGQAPGWGAPQPGGYPPQQQPGPYGPPPGQQAAPPAWGQPAQQPGYGAPQYGAPPAAQPAPAPAPGPYGPPPGPSHGGFAPAPDQHRHGSPEGLNPFGATMSPNGASPLAVPAPVAPGEHQPRWNDPAAFAATAPPPTTDEHEAAQRGGAQRAERASAPSPEQRPSGPPAVQSGRTQAQRAVAGAGLDPEQVPANAARTLAGFLVTYDSGELGSFWPIYQGRNEIGRKGAAEGLDVEIDHPTTSSRHAVIIASARPARLKLEDPGSTNGTFVSDTKLENGRKYELKDGEIIRFGAFSTIVKIV